MMNEGDSNDDRQEERQEPLKEGEGVDTGSNKQVDEKQRRYPLASRSKRLLAKMIDNLLMTLLIMPFATFLGVAELESLVVSGEIIPFSLLLKMQLGAFVSFLALNAWWLHLYGQTVGKRLLKIAIANENYQVPDFNRLVLIRHFPFFVVRAIPGLNLINLVDVFLIFREDRRCLHDIIAGTQVINIG